MSTFPSILTSYTNPLGTNPLNAPSHAAIETAQNGGLTQVEAVIGLAAAASTLGTIQYDLRSPASNGGGHVQSANTGGTGQTSFNKGDILIASSSSVLSKLAVGTDGQVLKADSTQSSGTSWSNVVASKVAVQATGNSISGGRSSVANVLFSATVPGGTLGTNNAVRFSGAIGNFNNNTGVVTIDLQYGSSSVASIQITPSSSVFGMKGVVEGFLVANGSTSAQSGFIELRMGDNAEGTFIGGNAQYSRGYATGTSAVSSASDASLIVNITMAGANGQTASPSILSTIFVIDKIV